VPTILPLHKILGTLEIFPADRMNTYPISNDIELPGSYPIHILKPAGERIYKEVEQKFIPHRHWGHKQKGVGSGNYSFA
jgi:hypothetical protein